MASRGWVVGWTVGGGVVVVAAGLLLELIRQARAITGHAREIETALEGATARTDALFEVREINAALEQLEPPVPRQ